MLKTLSLLHSQIFNSLDFNFFFSPGRVNLIGEHTDYNGGYCLPCTINLGTYACVSKNTNSILRVFSNRFSADGVVVIDYNNLIEKNNKYPWINYLSGILKFLQNFHKPITFGLDITITSDIPIGCGLSSSASIETLLITIFDNFYNLQISNINKVQICKDIENNFVGVACGIMDQFITLLGKTNTAILLNCTNLNTFKYIDFILNDYCILIMNTNKPRYLMSSTYNNIVNDCTTTVNILQQRIAINSLSDLTIKQLEENKYLLTKNEYYLRAKHVINENHRTITAADFLKNNQIEEFAKLINESHVSLRDDYKVTGVELDCLVETAWQHKDCLGARMTGAGMGGCAISIIKKDAMNSFISDVRKVYLQKTGLNATFYNINTVDGAHRISHLSSQYL